MTGFETIQVAPDCVWIVPPEDAVPQSTSSAEINEPNKEPAISTAPKPNLTLHPSVLDIARKMNWKVGKKDIRQIGQGEIPGPGQCIEINGWHVMRAIDYPGIVSQEALERVQILLDEGVKIKGLLIADDLRHRKPGLFQAAAKKVTDRVKAIDWQKAKNDFAEGTKEIASAISGNAASIAGDVRKKADNVDWNKVKKSLGTGLKAIALIAAGFASLAAAIFILPLIALVAVPVALFTIDPWLIVVDAENQFFVIAEWWD